jgi:hypothetical protein
MAMRKESANPTSSAASVTFNGVSPETESSFVYLEESVPLCAGPGAPKTSIKVVIY